MENAREAFDVIFYWCGVWLTMKSITVVCVKASAALRKRARRRYGERARQLTRNRAAGTPRRRRELDLLGAYKL